MLFSPVKIGRVEIKNRVAMTAMGVELARARRWRQRRHHRLLRGARQRRGRPDRQRALPDHGRTGAGGEHQIAARTIADVEDLERLMDAVHKYGARMFVQLHHPGGEYSGEAQAVAASAAQYAAGQTPRALTIPEIGEIQQAS